LRNIDCTRLFHDSSLFIVLSTLRKYIAPIKQNGERIVIGYDIKAELAIVQNSIH